MARNKYKHLIQSEWQDEDGYWIALKSGYQDSGNPTCHTIHEDTKAEAYSYLSSVIPCDCWECRKDKEGNQ
jgi:hypothetical protein